MKTLSSKASLKTPCHQAWTLQADKTSESMENLNSTKAGNHTAQILTEKWTEYRPTVSKPTSHYQEYDKTFSTQEYFF